MEAKGKPTAEELTLLEPFRDELPAEVFGEAYTPPVSNGSGQDRKLLRTAHKLLEEAGWTLEAGKRVNAKGEQLDIEFLLFSPSFERVINPYIENLKRLGIAGRIRLVDSAQYERRVKSFDFDVTTRRYVLRLTPGQEIVNYWGSVTADADGSLNLAGIKNPVVDKLIDKALAAGSREELNTIMRATDRVLRAGHYWVPHWYKAAHNMAFWDKFAWPETKPRYGRGIIATWWYDAQKAAKLEQR